MAVAAYSPEADMRLEDFLDDKLQSSTDLDSRNLSALLETVECQHNVLQTQLDEAARALEIARRSSKDRQALLRARLDEFEELQRSIDLRQSMVAQSDAPDMAVQRLSNPLDQLHRAEVARSYVATLADVEAWRVEALSHLPASPKEALEPYAKIKRLASRLKELQGQADGAAVHLVSYVGSVASYLWDEMQATMAAEMEGILKARKWPVEVSSESDMDAEWLGCFEKVLDLQVPEILCGSGQDKGDVAANRVVTLLPLDAMAKPFIQEFRFHFLSDRPTSKPEALPACLRWFSGLISKWEDFLRLNIAPLLAAKFDDISAETKLVYVDPVSAFITSMLPAMREKVLSIADLAKGQPQFLSSLIADLTIFDDKMRHRFHYDGGDAEFGWAGLTSEVLDRHFDVWFQAEKKFALERFQGIMKNPESRGIDYEFGGPGKTKPTQSAIQIKDLLKNVTLEYRGLRSFEYKLRFLVEIQNAVLEEFDDMLRGSLEAYQSLTSTVGRTLHGGSKKQLAALEGTGAFDSLCKVLGSSDYVARTLEAWAMDEFFTGFWSDIQGRARQLDSHSSANFFEGLSYMRVKSVTSTSLGQDAGEAEGSTIFDAPISSFSNNRKRAEEFLVGALVESSREAFKAYVSKTQWAALSDGDVAVTPETLPTSPDLSLALETLGRNLEYTHKTVCTPTHRRVWRQALAKLEDMLYTQLLMYHNFTTLGSAQLVRDLSSITALVDRFLKRGHHFARLGEAVLVLSLPVVVGKSDGNREGKEGGGTGSLTLDEVYAGVFASNDAAREVLAKLGVESLTPAEARKVLQRRVESNE